MNPRRDVRILLLIIASALLIVTVGGVAMAENFSPEPVQSLLLRPSDTQKLFLPLVMRNFNGSITPPTAPSGLSGQNIAQGWIRLFWTDNSHNATSFIVQQNIAGNFTTVKTVSGTVPSADIQSLSAATPYTFRVYACNGSGCSGYSNSTTVTTLVAPPAAPTNLVATLICYDRINLSWTDNSNDENGFRVEWQPPLWNWQFVPANTTSTVITNLTGNITYTLRVHAENDGGDSGFSNYVSVTTPFPMFFRRPCAPSNLTAVPLSSTSVQLNWTDNSTIESGFHVQQALHGGAFSTVQSPVSNTTTTVINGLTANTTYDFRVSAYNIYGDSPYSNAITVKTLADTTPAAPSYLTAAATSPTSIVLNWQDNSNNETGFIVEEKIGSGSFTALTPLAAGTTTLARDGRTASTQYSYHVKAVNGALSSAWSNVVTVATPSNAAPPVSLPNAPTNLRTEVTSTSTIYLWWDNPRPNNEEGVELEHSTDGVNFSTDGGYGAIEGADIIGVQDGSLDPVSIHYYRVRTYNSDGHGGKQYSAWSNVAYDITWGTVTPAEPTGLIATAVSSSVVHLKYNHSMANVEGFLYSYSMDNVHWSADFGGLRTLEVDITALPNPGQQYWFKVRAYNRNGNLSSFNCGTNPMHCSAYSASATATTTGGGGNTARFVNNSSYPVISLQVDGVEQFASPNGIQVGGYYELTTLTPGIAHNVAWANGFWQGSSPFKMYQGGGSFTPSSETATYTINNPSIGQLLTGFGAPGTQAYWMGQVWQNGVVGSRGFCFRNDSNQPNAASHWWFYRDGVYDNSSGVVTLTSYPIPGTFTVKFSVYTGDNFVGTLDESAGLADFYMHNGPPDWQWVDYYQTSGACPSHP